MIRLLFCTILAFISSFSIADPYTPRIGNGNQINQGYFALLETDGSGWKVDSIGQKPPQITNKGSQEILVFSNELDMVEPYYSNYVNWFEINDPSNNTARNNFAKGIYSCFSNQEKTRPAYNPCDSSLALHIDKGSNTAANVMVDVLSLGTALLTSGSLKTMTVDQLKINQLLKNSDVLSAVKTYRTKQTEQWAFSRADSSAALKNFIANFKDNDVDGLVPQAENKLPSVEAQEASIQLASYHQAYSTASTRSDYEGFINTYQDNDPDGLIPKVRAKLNELIAKERATEKLEHEELEKWRNSLQVGDETNCGEVLELRRGLVKVNFPVMNYGNEHWIRKDLILKPGADCQFVNGNYIPPYNG